MSWICSVCLMMACEFDKTWSRPLLHYKYCLVMAVMDGPFIHLLTDASHHLKKWVNALCNTCGRLTCIYHTAALGKDRWRTHKTCNEPSVSLHGSRKSLAHPKTYATETILKAILISLCKVSRAACTNFKMIMMSTSFFFKLPRRGDVGRLEPLVIGYEDRKVTR